MFCKVYRVDRVVVRVRIQLSHEGEGKNAFQVDGAVQGASTVMVRSQVQRPGLGLGLSV